jgi:signal transduction histidine kinase
VTSARFATVAAAAAAVLVGVALLLRLTVPIPAESGGTERFVPVLLAGAALCASGLSIRRAPTVAWLGALGAAGIAALEILGVVRAWQPLASIGAWPWLVGTADAALASAGTIAAAYAARARSPGSQGSPGARRSLRRFVTVAAIAGVAAMIGLVLWGLATAFSDAARTAPAPDLWPIRWTARLGLGLVVVGGIVGALEDLAGPVSRARARLASPARTDSARTDRTRPEFATFMGLLLEDLLPAAPGQRRRVADQERARLAADLHARVLPDLRRAAADATAPGVPPSVAAGVRDALAEVEDLMAGRQSIVLETFGLVAALEWLAERTEERASVRVAVELEGDSVADPTAVRPDVRRSAFRIALLALDNVVRHAAATQAILRLRVDPGVVDLTIVDDGLGIERGDRAGSARSGRGIADMRAEAAAVGASLSVTAAHPGTAVELRWRAGAVAEEPAIADAHFAARPESPGR